METLFIIAKGWKQPSHPLLDEWINKLLYTHVMEIYSIIKKQWTIKPWKTWMNRKYILLTQKSKLEKATYYMTQILLNYGKGKSIGRIFFGTGDSIQGHSTSELHPQPYFLFFVLKQGLTKLQRASLSSWGWLGTCLWSSCLSLPSTGFTGLCNSTWCQSHFLETSHN